MDYRAFATDYDGTVAHDGRVNEPTLRALERLRDAGFRIILVTGREVRDICAVFPETGLCDRVVAENGAVLYRPARGEEIVLGERPPSALLEALRSRGVGPFSVGECIVAMEIEHQKAVLDAIHELHLSWQVILNKGTLTILPAGVDKGSGLSVALAELGITAWEVVAVGDAENDLPFVEMCGFSAAVANALPILKEHSNLVTRGERGAGVIELIEKLLGGDLPIS